MEDFKEEIYTNHKFWKNLQERRAKFTINHKKHIANAIRSMALSGLPVKKLIIDNYYCTDPFIIYEELNKEIQNIAVKQDIPKNTTFKFSHTNNSTIEEQVRINTKYTNDTIICDLVPNSRLDLILRVEEKYGYIDNKYSLIHTCKYKKITDNKFELELHNNGEIKIKDLITNIKNNLIERIKVLLNTEVHFAEGIAKLYINNESEMFGQLITCELSEIKQDLDFTKYYFEDDTIRRITWEIVHDNEDEIHKLIEVLVNKLVEIFTNL